MLVIIIDKIIVILKDNLRDTIRYIPQVNTNVLMIYTARYVPAYIPVYYLCYNNYTLIFLYVKTKYCLFKNNLILSCSNKSSAIAVLTLKPTFLCYTGSSIRTRMFRRGSQRHPTVRSHPPPMVPYLTLLKFSPEQSYKHPKKLLLRINPQIWT